MTKDDRIEIRQMLTDVISGHANEMNGRFNVIHTNLIQIKEQTTKTNGRVNNVETEVEELKTKELLHVINCPLQSRVKVLEDNDLSKKAVTKFLLLIGGIAGGIAGGIIGIIQLLINIK